MQTKNMIKTSVWWDIENCEVPRRCNPNLVARNIFNSLHKIGYHGLVTISAYGNTDIIPSHVAHAICSTGIALNHVPSIPGVKDASDKIILADMIFWAMDNPPPANILLISGDRDFSGALNLLRLRQYNIMLAHPQCVAPPLLAAANCVWFWASLAAGQPPSLSDKGKVKSSNFVSGSRIKIACTKARSRAEHCVLNSNCEKPSAFASDSYSEKPSTIVADVEEECREKNKESTNNDKPDGANFPCSSSGQQFNEENISVLEDGANKLAELEQFVSRVHTIEVGMKEQVIVQHPQSLAVGGMNRKRSWALTKKDGNQVITKSPVKKQKKKLLPPSQLQSKPDHDTQTSLSKL